ncbi:MAG: TolC family protein, partial [Bacteroidota bacterium]
MIFHLRIVLLLLFFFSPLFQKGALLAGEKSNGGLTLAESIRLALEKNKRVVQTKELISGSEAKVEEARSIYFPQLKLESNYYRLSWLPEINFALPGLPTEKIKFGVYNNYGAQLSLYQSLFTWGRSTKGIELSEVELSMAKATAALTEREIAYAVVQLFYQILMVQEAVKVIDENLKLLNEHFSFVRKKYDAGELSHFDVLSTEVHISTTSGQKLDAETNLKKLELQFNKILGRAAHAVVQLERPPYYAQTSIDDKLYIQEAVE